MVVPSSSAAPRLEGTGSVTPPNAADPKGDANIANAQALPVYLRWNNGGVFIVAFLIWIAGIFARVRFSYLIWTALLMTIYICGSSLEGVPRYLSVAFPLFIILGIISARFPSLG